MKPDCSKCICVECTLCQLCPRMIDATGECPREKCKFEGEEQHADMD